MEGLAITLAAYLEESEVKLPPVSIRLTTSVHLTRVDIRESAKKLDIVCQNVFKGFFPTKYEKEA